MILRTVERAVGTVARIKGVRRSGCEQSAMFRIVGNILCLTCFSFSVENKTIVIVFFDDKLLLQVHISSVLILNVV